MKQILFFIILFPILSSNITAQLNKSKTSGLKDQISHNELGKVKIIVLGTNLVDDPSKEPEKGLDIQPFRTYLQSKNFLREMLYQDNGEFVLDVPEGMYSIVLRANWDEQLPYQRAKFYVSPNKITKLRIANEQGNNEVCDKKFGRVMIPSDSSVNIKGVSFPKYNDFLIHKSYDFVIKYCRKQNQKNTTTYTFALFTYKNLTMTAYKIKINKKSLIVEGYADKDSKVEIEVGDCVKERNKVRLNLNKLRLSDFECKQIQK